LIFKVEIFPHFAFGQRTLTCDFPAKIVRGTRIGAVHAAHFIFISLLAATDAFFGSFAAF
jgi:hypothetical protein